METGTCRDASWKVKLKYECLGKVNRLQELLESCPTLNLARIIKERKDGK